MYFEIKFNFKPFKTCCFVDVKRVARQFHVSESAIFPQEIHILQKYVKKGLCDVSDDGDIGFGVRVGVECWCWRVAPAHDASMRGQAPRCARSARAPRPR